MGRRSPCASTGCAPSDARAVLRYGAPVAKPKKKSNAEVRAELEALSRGPEKPVAPPFDLKKTYTRVAMIVGGLWLLAGLVRAVTGHNWPLIAAGVLSVAAAGGVWWIDKTMKKNLALQGILQNADTPEGRKAALEKLETDFKKDDAAAALAKAQLEMQENPQAALTTLEAVDLAKQMAPVANQVRAMRAMIHLQLGDPKSSRKLVDDLDLGKQDDDKIRAMFATVAAEAWARTGDAQKAKDTLDLFDPEKDTYAELRIQMWRARAFTAASLSDIKGIGRALRKLADTNPHLLAMFVNQKKIHPLLEKEAKTLLMKSGLVQRPQMRVQR